MDPDESRAMVLQQHPITDDDDDDNDDNHNNNIANNNSISTGAPTPPPSSSILTSRNTPVTALANTALKLFITLVLLACVVFVVVDSSSGGRQRVKTALLTFLDWVEYHPAEGVFAFIVVKAAATLLFVPGFILAFGIGFAFGMAFGTLRGVALASAAVFIGASIGSVLAFLLGRYLCKECTKRRINNSDICRAVFGALEKEGLKIMILLRLSPLVPYNVLSYMCGITCISLRSFTLALFGMVPGVILFCLVGSTASNLTESTANMRSRDGVVTVIFVGCGIAFSVLGLALTSYYAKRELNKILEMKQSDEVSSTVSVSSPGDYDENNDDNDENDLMSLGLTKTKIVNAGANVKIKVRTLENTGESIGTIPKTILLRDDSCLSDIRTDGELRNNERLEEGLSSPETMDNSAKLAPYGIKVRVRTREN